MYSLFTRRRGIDTSIGQFTHLAAVRQGAGTSRLPLLLRLPQRFLLEQTVTLPLAAAREPERVLTYEMDRLTPFKADALFWTWSSALHDVPAGRCGIRLSLILRAQVQPLLTALQPSGLHPVALETAVPGGWRHVALAHRRQGWAARRGPALAGALCAALVTALVIVPFVAQDRAMARVEARIAILKPQVAEAEAMRRTVVERAATTDVMQAARAKAGDALSVLATLTAALPDDTHLTDLVLRSRALTITGESAAATRLIATLAAEPGFLNPSFAAPVTRTLGGGAEGFSIRASIAP